MWDRITGFAADRSLGSCNPDQREEPLFERRPEPSTIRSMQQSGRRSRTGRALFRLNSFLVFQHAPEMIPSLSRCCQTRLLNWIDPRL
jgi:hypothetical protein